MVGTDPVVKAGLFNALHLNWYCSAALMDVNNIHLKKFKIFFSISIMKRVTSHSGIFLNVKTFSS